MKTKMPQEGLTPWTSTGSQGMVNQLSETSGTGPEVALSAMVEAQNQWKRPGKKRVPA